MTRHHRVTAGPAVPGSPTVPGCGRECGSMLPLVAFFAFLTLAVTLAVAAATSLYLERERLYTVADGAALAAAESFALEDVGVAAGVVTARLGETAAAAAARRSVAALPAAAGTRLQDVAVERVTTDGRRVAVTVRALWRPPLVSVFLRDSITLRVTSAARPSFG